MHIGSRFARIVAVGAIAGLTGTTLFTLFAPSALADEANEVYKDSPFVQGVRFGEILNEFDDAYFSHDRTYYQNRSIPGQIKYLLGPFPENTMYQDGKDVNKLYREMMYRQMNAGPILRTIDLPTPFPYSLRTLPPTLSASPVEVIPSPVAPPPMAVPAPQPVPAQKPVPALW